MAYHNFAWTNLENQYTFASQAIFNGFDLLCKMLQGVDYWSIYLCKYSYSLRITPFSPIINVLGMNDWQQPALPKKLVKFFFGRVIDIAKKMLTLDKLFIIYSSHFKVLAPKKKQVRKLFLVVCLLLSPGSPPVKKISQFMLLFWYVLVL